jgi:hypothetical protein
VAINCGILSRKETTETTETQTMLAFKRVYYLGSSWYRISLKKMLAQVNECFIFEKLDDKIFGRALGKYKKDNNDYIDVEGMNNISIIDFFNEDVDSKSISFTQALTRAVLMLDIEELSDKPNKTDFRKSINRLTNY